MATATASPTTDAKTTHRVRLTLCLDGVPYTVRPLARGDLPFEAVRGFTLARTDRRLGRVRHTITEGFEGLACSCGDQTYRKTPSGGICKHLAAGKACGLL